MSYDEFEAEYPHLAGRDSPEPPRCQNCKGAGCSLCGGSLEPKTFYAETREIPGHDPRLFLTPEEEAEYDG